MKAILRKGMVACAAMLMGANVMAQSFELTREIEKFSSNIISPTLMSDKTSRFIIVEDSGEKYYSGLAGKYYQLNKLTILDKNMSIEKEFTSGPLFEEIKDAMITHTSDGNEVEQSVRKTSAYHKAIEGNVSYINYAEERDNGAIISQCLFNNDDKYEFLLPELAVFETEQENWDGNVVTTCLHKIIGYKIVSEDGTVLQKLIVNENKDPKMNYCYASVINLNDKNHLIVECQYGYEGESDYREVTYFYEIKKDGTGIEKVREIRGAMNIAPTLADRDAQITITLNDENSNAARELIITGVNGQLVERRDIPAGENTVTVSAAMMRSGMYNFTLQKKGEIMDNGKVIVK